MVPHAVRVFLKNPGFTVAAVLTIAIGIGANTAIYSVVQGVLLKPFPYREQDRLMVLWGALALSRFLRASSSR